MKRGVFALFCFFRLFGFQFFCENAFAANPIQEKSYHGAAAAEARLKLISKAES